MNNPSRTSAGQTSRAGRYLTIAAAVVAAVVAGTIARVVVRDLMKPSEASRAASINDGLRRGLETYRGRLPMKLDDVTTLVDVQVSGTKAIYFHHLTATPTSFQATSFERDLRQRVCASTMKDAIIAGASFQYTYSTPPPASLPVATFTISSCP